MTENRQVQTCHFGGCLVLTVGQELDADLIDRIGELLPEAAHAVVINLRGDCATGIEAVVALLRLGAARLERGGSLHIVTTDDRLHMLAGDLAFVYSDPGDALESAMAMRAARVKGSLAGQGHFAAREG